LADELAEFREFGQLTRITETVASAGERKPMRVPTFVNEFWTARQRQANNLHEISYRACFKPQLPRFFIERLTRPGDVVYDPFMGRGTTLLEAALLERVPWGCDANPLSLTLVAPRLDPPTVGQVGQRLRQIDFGAKAEAPEDLLVFYHPETLREIAALRRYLLERQADGSRDAVDHWIALVALNRLTGHSPGFFSVYTLPPNQATSVVAQRRINQRRNQVPPRRKVPDIILRKTGKLLSDCDEEVRKRLAAARSGARLVTAAAAETRELPQDSVRLVVTSPPFLNVVQYATDNWLRCWFLGIDSAKVQLTITSKLELWQEAMTAVFRELRRILKPGGHVAFEVGEVHGGATRLEDYVLPAGADAGLQPVLILINDQEFTKTANCWGVNNNDKGTNSNRIVVFAKPAESASGMASPGRV
jgi:hypothetical protein